MIICLCRRISDRDIVQAVRDGVSGFEQLQDETGVASHCGCCHDCARETFDAALEQHGCGRRCAGAAAGGRAVASPQPA